MTTMISEVYDALRDAHGVSEEKARRAAEAVAASEKRFVDLEKKIGETKSDLELPIEEVKGQLRVMQWMRATLVAGTVAILLKLYG